MLINDRGSMPFFSFANPGVCSYVTPHQHPPGIQILSPLGATLAARAARGIERDIAGLIARVRLTLGWPLFAARPSNLPAHLIGARRYKPLGWRSEEHTSELQSLAYLV